MPAQIIIVDDDPEVGRTLRDLLAANGHTAVRIASSGEEALRLLAEEPADLVLMDARMPGLGGFETCALIRERHGPSLPVVMVTAFGDREAVRQASEAGADDLIQKPVDTAALMLKVRAFLRLKSLHDEIVENREEAQARVRDLALLHEIGRDWSLMGQPEEFYRMVTERLASLIGAPICLMALYDSATKTLAAALPVHGLPDEQARKIRYVVRPEYRSLWNFSSGRPYLSNRARNDPRLIQEVVQVAGAESLVLVPMISEGDVLGLIAAINKPGGFSESDVQLLSIFAGPAATFLRSRQIFDRQRSHGDNLEHLAALTGAMAGATKRDDLLDLTVSRIHKELGYERVTFWAVDALGRLRAEFEAGTPRPAGSPGDGERLKWVLRGSNPLQSAAGEGGSELGLPVRAGERAFGVLNLDRGQGAPFGEEEVNLLTAVAGQLALALQKAESMAQTEKLARQMATLYDLGLETSALRDLRLLFVKAAEEAGRLIKAEHTSVLRLDYADSRLRLLAAWARDPGRESFSEPVFRLGEGVAGRVARDRIPAMINDADTSSDVVRKGNPVSRLLCVPVTYYDQEREASLVFGVLNATRQPGAPAFGPDDLEYLTRFAGQLSIAVGNSMAFAAERERSEQLSLVNALLREIAGNLSRERVFDTAVRRIHEAFHYPVVMIGVLEPQTGLHRIMASVGGLNASWGTYPLTEGITGRAMREKQTILVPDVAQSPDYIRAVPGTRSEVAVPITSGGEVVAVLNVESDVLGAFNRRGEVITLETLADGIGIILRNAELYQALENTNAKLLELDRLKSELVNIVAHDFRAPLAGVLGYAELLEWKPDAPTESRIESARAIVNAATHMSNMVDKTLKTSRLETGQFPFEFGVVDVGATVRSVLSRFPESSRHPITCTVPEDPMPCWADRDRLAEVLENLVSNAIKYSPQGGGVRVEARVEDETVVVAVSDRGLGIAASDMGRLFRPFSRVRNKVTQNIEGSGLGLYICDRIVRAHGGRLWTAESVAGAGSTFCFSLPLFGLGAQTRPPLILVATGDEGTRREVRRAAEELGYGLHEVADGVEAVEAAMRLLPSALVLDRVLPKLGAEEIAERLRVGEQTSAIPLFVLASEADVGEHVPLFRACVPKPLDRGALLAILEPLSARAGELLAGPD